MKKEDYEKLQPEIQEYIQLMKSIGILNSNNKDIILDKLNHTKIFYVEDLNGAGGYTEIDENGNISVEICKKQIEKESEQMHIDFEQLLYINIFHELTHASSILSDELEGRINLLFSNVDKQDNNYPWMFHGYTIVDEYIAQSISQKLMEKKYQNQNMFPIKHDKFTYNENGYLPKEQEISYEYDSNLVYYGEIEGFALKFVESLYGDKNIDRLYEDHLQDRIFEVLQNTFKNRRNGMQNLYNMFGNMSNIIIGDYYQQGYYGPEKRTWSNIELFKKSINEFNRISELEIDRQLQK